MGSKFVEIEESVYENLSKVASDNGIESVEKLLTKFAENFSNGCSVTLNFKNHKAA